MYLSVLLGVRLTHSCLPSHLANSADPDQTLQNVIIILPAFMPRGI